MIASVEATVGDVASQFPQTIRVSSGCESSSAAMATAGSATSAANASCPFEDVAAALMRWSQLPRSAATTGTPGPSDHDEAGRVVRLLRTVTDRYEPPAGACATWPGLFRG
jgi:hypothetical protein